MVKVKSFILGLSTFGILSGVAGATELVCVNGNKLMEETIYAKKLKKEVKAKIEALQKETMAKIEPLQKKLEQLQKELQSGLLTEEAKKQKQKEFKEIQNKLIEYRLSYQQEVQTYLKTEYVKLDKLVKSALKALAKTEKFKAVVNCDSFLYYDPSIDITEKVAKMIDQMTKTSKGKEQK